MGRYRCIQIFLNIAYCLLVFCVADFRPLVIGGFFKLVASLVLAYLLAFVIVQRANIYKLVGACLRAIPMPPVPLLVDRRWVKRWQTTIVVPNGPSLSPLFQRPPPTFSL